MTTKPLKGGSVYTAELARIREAANDIRFSLEKLIDGNPGPHVVIAHTARMAIKLNIIMDALPVLEQIGKDEKAERIGGSEE